MAGTPAVAEVYRALPEEERGRTTIVGGNYGRAGALAAYHEELGLPYPVSRAGDFWAWGYGDPEPIPRLWARLGSVWG